MSVPRFHCAALARAAVGSVIELPEAVAHHAVRVVRLVEGDALTLFDGAGGEFAATLTAVHKRGAQARVERFDAIERESPLSVTLAQAIAANDAMDYAVRKAVELGVARIVPLICERSAPLPPGDRSARRHAHWLQIAIAACEQSGRNRLPEIAGPVTLDEWLPTCADQPMLVALTEGGTRLASVAAASACTAIVGPEGGFTARELTLFDRAGVMPISLGPRVLRTETAAVAALAVLQALWGDL